MRTARIGRVVQVLAITSVAFLLLPLVVVVGSSIGATNYVTFPPEGFSFHAYREALDQTEFMHSLWLSAQIAAVVGVLATVLGTMAAIARRRVRRGLQGSLEASYLAPLGMPHLVLGVAVLQLLGVLGLGISLITLAAGHLVISFPYAARLTGAALAEADENLDRAAATLGAGEWFTFRRVTLPILRPALMAALFIAANVSFDNVGISLFLSSADVVTLPVRMFNYLEFRFAPFLTAIGSLLIIVPLLAAAFAERFYGLPRLFGLGAAERRTERDTDAVS